MNSSTCWYRAVMSIGGGDVVHRVVVVNAVATVQISLGGQAIQRIPLEAVGLIVLVAQFLQTPVGVITETHLLPQRINTLLDPSAGVVVVLGAQVSGVGVTTKLACQVALVAINAPIRAFAFDQLAAQVVTVPGGFASSIGAAAQVAALVVTVMVFRVGAIAIQQQLAVAVPRQGLVFIVGINDLHHLALRVIAVAGGVSERVFFAEQVAAFVVAEGTGVTATVGDAQRQCPVFGVEDVFAATEWVAGFDQAADVIVDVMPFAALWVGGLEQLPGEQVAVPALAQRVDVVIDLVECAPVIAVLAAEAVRHAGFALGQVVMKMIVLAITAPVAGDPPLVVGLRSSKGGSVYGVPSARCSKQISLRISVSLCLASTLVMMLGTVRPRKMHQLERRE